MSSNATCRLHSLSARGHYVTNICLIFFFFAFPPPPPPSTQDWERDVPPEQQSYNIVCVKVLLEIVLMVFIRRQLAHKVTYVLCLVCLAGR